MTKDEFDSFIAGFMMGISGSQSIRVSEFKTILNMVDDVLATEVSGRLGKALQSLNDGPLIGQQAQTFTPIPWAIDGSDDTADNVPAMGGSSLDTSSGPQYGPPATEGSDPTIDVMSPTNADGSAASDDGGGSSDGGGGSDGSSS